MYCREAVLAVFPLPALPAASALAKADSAFGTNPGRPETSVGQLTTYPYARLWQCQVSKSRGPGVYIYHAHVCQHGFPLQLTFSPHFYHRVTKFP